MFVKELLVENPRYTTAALVASAIITYLVTSVISVVLQRIRFYKKPCDLPVLNLKDGDYEKAKMDFMVNLPKYLEEGREKASRPLLQRGPWVSLGLPFMSRTAKLIPSAVSESWISALEPRGLRSLYSRGMRGRVEGIG